MSEDIFSDQNASTSSRAPKPTSLLVFKRFINRTAENHVDATGVFSPECYEEWLKTRQKIPKRPEESFRRALTAHVRGSDNRSPFTMEEESALLDILRNTNAFASSFRSTGVKIGKYGFRGLGYHEQKLGKSNNSLFNRLKKRRKPTDTTTIESSCIGSERIDSQETYEFFCNTFFNSAETDQGDLMEANSSQSETGSESQFEGAELVQNNVGTPELCDVNGVFPINGYPRFAKNDKGMKGPQSNWSIHTPELLYNENVTTHHAITVPTASLKNYKRIARRGGRALGIKAKNSTRSRETVDLQNVIEICSANTFEGRSFREYFMPLLNSLDQKTMRQLIISCRRNRVPLLGSNSIRSIKFGMRTRDIRYQTSFLCPEDAFFMPHLGKTGIIVMDLQAARMVDSDKNFREVFKMDLSSPVGSRQASATMKHVLFSILFPRMFALKVGEHCWVRQYLVNGHGDPCWFLSKMWKASKDLVVFETQDISKDEFIQSLSLKPLQDEYYLA